MFAGEEWRCGGGEEDLRDRAEKKKTDTKRPCVNVVALRLKIMNAVLICKLSVLQRTRSAPLAAPSRPGPCAILTRSGWMCDVFRGVFSCMKEVWPSSTATQRASLPVAAVGGKFIAPSQLCLAKLVHFLYSSISIIFPFTSAAVL